MNASPIIPTRDGRCADAPLCHASHSTAYGVFALRVAAAIAIVFALLWGTLMVTP